MRKFSHVFSYHHLYSEGFSKLKSGSSDCIVIGLQRCLSSSMSIFLSGS